MPRKSVDLRVFLLRAAFFACIALLVALSWLPGSAMVRTGISGRIEHAVAYFGTAFIMGLAYRDAPRLLVQFALLVALAAILEVGQLYVPGRTSAFLDFAASSTGVAAGGLLMRAARPGILSYLGFDRRAPDP
jgi:VanZ family protein